MQRRAVQSRRQFFVHEIRRHLTAQRLRRRYVWAAIIAMAVPGPSGLQDQSAYRRALILEGTVDAPRLVVGPSRTDFRLPVSHDNDDRGVSGPVEAVSVWMPGDEFLLARCGVEEVPDPREPLVLLRSRTRHAPRFWFCKY